MILHTLKARCACALLSALLLANVSSAGTVVRYDTVLGSFDIELFDSQMPRTVGNFLSYVNSKRYDGSVVHRNSDTFDPVQRDFVIQGGGFFLNDPVPPNQVISFANVVTPADQPIDDEPGNEVTGPSNVRGTIAMAKGGPNTATSQWFINQGDNSFLDSPSRPDGGFSAFGQVLGNGMTVVDAIGDLPLPTDFGFSISSPFNDLPLRNFNGDEITDIRESNTVVVNSISVFPDFNHDGDINVGDLSILKQNFANLNATFEQGDANGDGRIDGGDLLVWQRNVGGVTGLSVLSVPEPSTSLLIFVGLLLFSRRR